MNRLAIDDQLESLPPEYPSNHVAFSGSSNETAGGLVENFESVDVFRSWIDPDRRVAQKIADFDALWENTTPGLEIIEFTEAGCDLLEYRLLTRIIPPPTPFPPTFPMTSNPPRRNWFFPIAEAPVHATVTHNGVTRDVRLPHRKALVAGDTGEVIGIVGEGYKVFTNDQAVTLCHKFCLEAFPDTKAAEWNFVDGHAWLAASGCLEIRLALRLDEDGRIARGIFHEKTGSRTCWTGYPGVAVPARHEAECSRPGLLHRPAVFRAKADFVFKGVV